MIHTIFLFPDWKWKTRSWCNWVTRKNFPRSLDAKVNLFIIFSSAIFTKSECDITRLQMLLKDNLWKRIRMRETVFTLARTCIHQSQYIRKRHFSIIFPNEMWSIIWKWDRPNTGPYFCFRAPMFCTVQIFRSHLLLVCVCVYTCLRITRLKPPKAGA